MIGFEFTNVATDPERMERIYRESLNTPPALRTTHSWEEMKPRLDPYKIQNDDDTRQPAGLVEVVINQLKRVLLCGSR